ncbi:hypothetical protein [Bradyrhizobium genosp. A]|uniref:hypothetical protein n=1 Tax=Bradyrhizobium genosp. A TaxID=83626 RepID=UPI003CEDBADA
MTNDTAVFDAMRLDPTTGEKEWIGRMGTRSAIARDGLEIDQASLGYCPHEWLDPTGYVDLELARQFPLMLAV